MSETTASIDQSTQHDITEDLTIQQHRCWNPKSRKMSLELRTDDWISYYYLHRVTYGDEHSDFETLSFRDTR